MGRCIKSRTQVTSDNYILNKFVRLNFKFITKLRRKFRGIYTYGLIEGNNIVRRIINIYDNPYQE